jgi:DNA or RNA helicases of superfamily II
MLLNGLRTGTLELLVQCELLGEGVDIKGASVLIQLRPTMSLVVFLQHIGRVLRYVEGKRAVILDHVGNYERHGLPDDPRRWSLDGIDKQDKGILIYKRCESCLRPVKKALSICPYCGAAFDMREGAGRELPTEREGVLVNVREVTQPGVETQYKHKRKEFTLMKRQAYDNYYAIFPLPEGKRKVLSTGTHIKAIAIEWAMKWLEKEAAGFELVSESFETHKRKTIARIASGRSLQQAIDIATDAGYNHKFGWLVWTKILKRRSA